MIVEIIGTASAAFMGWALGKLTARYKKPDPQPEEHLPPNVYHFEPHSDFKCPKCGLSWSYTTSAPEYCECEEFPEGHFHMKCNGNVKDKKDVGCHYKWIMMTKDSKLYKKPA